MTKSRDLANAATALNAVSATELGFVDGVTSAIQTQIDTKLATATAATTYVANSLADAKGDLFVASADNTVTRLPVGNSGEQIVADSSTSTGLRYQSNFAAGKNKIINGDFGVWQRGISATTKNAYCADRFFTGWDGTGTFTTSQETFATGAAPVAGYEGTYFQRVALNTSGTSTYYQTTTRIENVRTFAAQTITLSFWAKANTATTITSYIEQYYGSGGSATTGPSSTTYAVTTAWQRFSYTALMPSISGKTIGANNYLQLTLRSFSVAASASLDIWGVQFEASSVATSFQTATGTLQGELAACQRYYFRATAGGAYSVFGGNCSAWSSTDLLGGFNLPVTMRTTPTSLEFSSLIASDGVNNNSIGTLTIAASYSNPNYGGFAATSTSLTGFRFYRIQANNSTSAYIAYSAEL